LPAKVNDHTSPSPAGVIAPWSNRVTPRAMPDASAVMIVSFGSDSTVAMPSN
jgi:hypothetical protein